jgi:hypothetical protein
MSTFDIVEVFYAENERVYRVIEKTPNGQIRDIARLTSREKAEHYIEAYQPQLEPEE